LNIVLKLLSRNTRPGGSTHLIFIFSIFVQAIVVELCEIRLSPFDGFWSEKTWNQTTGISLSLLRIVAIVIALLELGTGLLLLSRPHLFNKSTKTSLLRKPFLSAYMILSAIPVYGLVLFVISGKRFDFYGFAVPAFLGLLLLLTQTDRWDKLAIPEEPTTGEGN
jgi:cytochrome b561